MNPSSTSLAHRIISSLSALVLVGCSLTATLTETIAPSAVEKIKVSLDITSLTMSEGSSAFINVTLSERRDTPTVVDVSLSSVRHDVSADFVPVVSSVTIPANALSAPLLLTSIQDTVYEKNEGFTLFLYSADASISIERAQTTVTILDDDPMPTVKFSSISQNINEGAGTGSIVAELSHESAFEIVVPYIVTSISATTADYTFLSGNITFASGELSKNLNFVVIDDSFAEPGETFSTTLMPSTSDVILGTDTTHTVTIVDNEATTLTINDVTVTEGGNLVFTVTLSTASTVAVGFDWATSAQTAVNGVNYNNANGSISVAPGTMTRTITVPTIDTSAVCEADRTLSVTLSNPSNATITDAVGLGTITDDDVPTLSITDNSASESTALGITATLSAACSTKTVTFKWSNSAGTATAGIDYGAITDQSASFAPGSTSVVLNTLVIDDTTKEPSETFTVTLSDIVNATAGTITATGTILDDDISTPLMLKDFNAAPALQNKIKMPGNLLYFANADSLHGLELWSTDGTETGTALLKDIYPGVGSSGPNNFYLNTTSNIVFFQATTPGDGNELWRTDGTAAGTFFLKDFNPGPDSYTLDFLGQQGNRVIIVTSSYSGMPQTLWSSEGTVSGTVQLLPSEGWVEITQGVSLSGYTYFGAVSSVQGRALWRTDGTPAGTTLVKQIQAGTTWYPPTDLVSYNGKLLFTAETTAGGQDPWISDGTTAGTTVLADLAPSGGYSSPFYGGQTGAVFVFSASDKVMVTNGVAAGTTTLSTSIERISENFGKIGNKLIFTCYSSLGLEPCASDGTIAGTIVLKDIMSNAENSLSFNQNIFATVNGRVVFGADDGVHGYELWTTDGTPSGTVLLQDIYPGIETSDIGELTTVGNRAIFSATSTAGRELWITDGTPAGTTLYSDAIAGSGSSTPRNMVAWNANEFFFTAYNANAQTATPFFGDITGTVTAFNSVPVPTDGSSQGTMAAIGTEVLFDAAETGPGNTIWKTDGTSSGTVKVKDVFPSLLCTDVANMVTVGNSVFFSASSPGVGSELWRSDGTSAGTNLVKDPDNASSSATDAYSFIPMSTSKMFFTAYTDATGTEPWISDGTSAGTFMLVETVAGPYEGLDSFSTPIFNSAQGLVYMIATSPSGNVTLWVTDGTSAGTRAITALGTAANIKIFAAGTKTYIGTNTLSYATDYKLWVTDGTNAGTVSITPAGMLMNSPYGGGSETAFGDKLFFLGNTSAAGIEPWVTDGTLTGTIQLKDMTAGNGSSYLTGTAAFGNKIVFGAGSATWISDGTSAGTVILDPSRAFNGGHMVHGGKLYFSRYDSTVGYEPWVTDGTSTGTFLLKDIYPGTISSGPEEFVAFNSKVYFRARDNTHGHELWETDGTPAGTKLAFDIAPGPDSGEPRLLKVFNGRLYFNANSLMHGFEVWVLEP